MDYNHKELATFMNYLPQTFRTHSEEKDSNNNSTTRNVATSSDSQSIKRETCSRSGPTIDSGYNSEISSPGETGGETRGSISGNGGLSDGGFVGDSSLASSFIDIEDIEDMGERIEFLRAKQEILESASSVLFDQEVLMTAQTASRGKHFKHTNFCLNETEEESVWVEARDILCKINCSISAADEMIPHSLTRLENKGSPKPKSTKKRGTSDQRQSADMIKANSSVKRVCSEAFDTQNMTSDSCKSTESRQGIKVTSLLMATSCFPFSEGHWMAQALIHCARNQHLTKRQNQKKRRQVSGHLSPSNYHNIPSGSPSSSSWRVMALLPCSNAKCPFPVLVPPPGYHLWNSMDLKTATTPQATSARLVTQATPPFLIVYANRAFLRMIEPEGGPGPCILGQPVETLIQVMVFHGSLSREAMLGGESLREATDTVTVDDDPPSYPGYSSYGTRPSFDLSQDICESTSSNSTETYGCSLDSILVPNGKTCRIQIVPVVDRSFPDERRQICLHKPLPGEQLSSKPEESNGSLSSDCMTHIMVQALGFKEPVVLNGSIVRHHPVQVIQSASASLLGHENSTTGCNPVSCVLGTVG